MVLVTSLPIRDRAGNTLLKFRVVTDVELERLDERAAVAASVIVVEHAGSVLMVFDSWRRQWELPGGAREPGETSRQAAVRELREETGIDGVDPDGVAVAEFDLVNPDRHELLAVHRVRLRVAPRLLLNDEVLDFLWWPPSGPVGDDMSPLDAEIARRVAHAPTVRDPMSEYDRAVSGGDVGARRDGIARPTIWIFHGDRARFAAGVFTTREAGLAWAAEHRVTGILTEYPIGGAYDVAITEGRFTPSRPHHGTPDHVAGFSPGLAHVHLTDGQP